MTMRPILVSVKMKRFNLIIILIVLLGTEFVNSSNDTPFEMGGLTHDNKMLNTGQITDHTKDKASPMGPDVSKVNGLKCPLPVAGVYIMGFTIGLLFLIILCLLVLIYKLKIKVFSKSIDDKIEITNNDTSCKYTRQLSTETNNVSYVRENSNEEGRFKLQRQGSKMTIVDYPNDLNINEKKGDEINNSRVTLSKVLLQQPVQIHRDQMKEIIQGVLSKKQRFNASISSLSNLDKILNEETKANESDNSAIVDKSASSGILDIIENFEKLPSPMPVKKLNKSSADTKTNTSKVVETNSNRNNYMPFKNLKTNSNKANDAAIRDVVHDNSPQNCRPVILQDCEGEHLDDVYDDPPKFVRPLTINKAKDEPADDVYDNPPNNKPVFNASASDNNLDDIYDNPPCNKPVFDKFSSSKPKSQEKDGNYDFPEKTSRGIVATEDADSEYVLTLTNDKEHCFDSNYSNAKSLKESNAK